MDLEMFHSALEIDEKILWTGQPDASVWLGSGDYFVVPFSIVWSSLGLPIGGLFLSILIKGTINPVTVVASTFFFTSLYLLVGRLFIKLFRKKHMYYAVTNQQVLEVYAGIFGKKIRSEYISEIPEVNKTIGKKGVGTVAFGKLLPLGYSIWENSGVDPVRGMTRIIGNRVTFYDIRDAEKVYTMVEDLRNHTPQKTPKKDTTIAFL